mgnify:CR=1 FL=1
MKLAEALRLRSDYQSEVNLLSQRIYDNSTRNEDVEPEEDCIKLMEQLTLYSKKQIALAVSISLINLTIEIEYASYYDNIKVAKYVGDLFTTELDPRIRKSKKLILQALVERDRLSAEIGRLNSIHSRSAPSIRHKEDDIKQVTDINREALRDKIDRMSKFLRMMDTEIQARNWLVDYEEKVLF